MLSRPRQVLFVEIASRGTMPPQPGVQAAETKLKDTFHPGFEQRETAIVARLPGLPGRAHRDLRHPGAAGPHVRGHVARPGDAGRHETKGSPAA